MSNLILTFIISTTVSVLLMSALIFLSKSWLSERLKNAIKHEYDEKLEAHKAKLKAEHDLNIETLKVKLKAKSDEAIAQLQHDLGDMSAERNARRDYKYEARKRLYEQYEPLLFQLVEFSESALYRIYSLARTSRNGDLVAEGNFLAHDGQYLSAYDALGWLGTPRYYMTSTIYELLAPLAIYKLMKRRLTLVDLQLDPRIATQYTLAKILYLTLSCDFEFASQNPIIQYTPNIRGWEEKRKKEASIYWRQGVPLYNLDSAVEEILNHEAESPFLRSFGEYKRFIFDDGEQNRDSKEMKSEPYYYKLADVFLGFHPKTRPVFWRALIAQAHLHRLIIKLFVTDTYDPTENLLNILPIPEEEREKFEWRSPADSEVSNDTVFQEPFSAAVTFVKGYVHQFMNR